MKPLTNEDPFFAAPLDGFSGEIRPLAGSRREPVCGENHKCLSSATSAAAGQNLPWTFRQLPGMSRRKPGRSPFVLGRSALAPRPLERRRRVHLLSASPGCAEHFLFKIGEAHVCLRLAQLVLDGVDLRLHTRDVALEFVPNRADAIAACTTSTCDSSLCGDSLR